jgi:hypothetical protein
VIVDLFMSGLLCELGRRKHDRPGTVVTAGISGFALVCYCEHRIEIGLKP